MMARALSWLLLKSRSAWWRVVYRGYRSRYTIGRTFRFNGAMINLHGDGRIELGGNSYIGEFSSIQACAGHSVVIGQHCAISHNVRIYTASNVADADLRLGPPPTIEGSVRIGDGVWIGTNVFIGPGVEIGSNVVVGANAVVTRSIPADEIWGGVPARLLRRKDTARHQDRHAALRQRDH
jgi:maltose O-acetyltransferase